MDTLKTHEAHALEDLKEAEALLMQRKKKKSVCTSKNPFSLYLSLSVSVTRSLSRALARSLSLHIYV